MITKAAMRASAQIGKGIGVATTIGAVMQLPPLFDAIRRVLRAEEIDDTMDLLCAVDELRGAFKATEGE